jgi:hypothetical protein
MALQQGTPPSDAHVPAAATSRHSRRALRVACYVVGLTPFLVGAIAESARGYRPTSDDAVIALRSWDALTAHGPLVGTWTNATASAAHTTFDPGPLLFWFLSLPVHLDHAQGALWGAAVLCMAGVALSIEAAWATRGWVGGVAVVAAVLLVVAAQPGVVLDPVWNPSVGLIWYLATAATAWATASGHLRFMPALVLAGSFTAQAHLMFALAAIVAVVIAAAMGALWPRPPMRWVARCGWLGGGLVVGLACWLAPVIQQLTSSPGNLSLLLASGHQGKEIGSSFGLNALVGAVSPNPLLFSSWSGNTFLSVAEHIGSHQGGAGIALLVALALVSVGAFALRRRELGALALISLIFAGAGVITTARIPVAFATAIIYLDRDLWLVAPLTWLVLFWLVCAVAWSAWRKWGQRRPWPVHLPRPTAPAVLAVIGACALALVAAFAVRVGGGSNGPASKPLGQAIAQATASARQVERLVPRGPVSVVVLPSGLPAYLVLPGVLWQLRSDGWTPQTPPPFVSHLGEPYVPTRGTPRVTVTLAQNGGVRVVRASRSGRHEGSNA